jgi:hypothetical protein
MNEDERVDRRRFLRNLGIAATGLVIAPGLATTAEAADRLRRGRGWGWGWRGNRGRGWGWTGVRRAVPRTYVAPAPVVVPAPPAYYAPPRRAYPRLPGGPRPLPGYYPPML